LGLVTVGARLGGILAKFDTDIGATARFLCEMHTRGIHALLRRGRGARFRPCGSAAAPRHFGNMNGTHSRSRQAAPREPVVGEHQHVHVLGSVEVFAAGQRPDQRIHGFAAGGRADAYCRGHPFQHESPMPSRTRSAAEHPALAAIRTEGHGKVKVAVSDIDGILRGKYLHVDKFIGAAQPHPAGGFGFCDVVFGWDSGDQCYDNTTLTGWQHGFPDALARLDLATARRVPWDGGVPFFVGGDRP